MARRPSPGEIAAGRALWQVACGTVAAPEIDDETLLRAAAKRFAWLTSPTMAAWLLAPLKAQVPDLLPAAEIERARLFNRFLRARARDELARIHAANIPVVALKGFATSARFYPDVLVRSMNDIDLLVRPEDIDRLCDLLEGHGFRFLLSEGTPVWGLTSLSSFHPFVSADRSLSIDFHVAPDDYPVARALSVDDVFFRARTIDVDGVPVLIPCDDDLVLLAVTNAARDKFDPAAMRSMVDIVAALARAGVRPDWDVLVARARRGGLMRPLRVAVRLLARLGVAPGLLPAALLSAYGGFARAAFDALADDMLAVFPHDFAPVTGQWRDWMLISSFDVLARRNLRRLRGLIRPWTGLPPGHRLGEP